MVAFGTKLTGLVLLVLAASPEEQRQQASALLAERQRALAAADAKAFFANFSDNAIIMGTAATERFELDEYRVWSAPMFARGPRHVATLVEENITVADDGKFAWFDQRTHRPGFGELRLSGVLCKLEDHWRIVQLNRGFLVPNEIVATLAEHIQKTNPDRARDTRSKLRAAEKSQADDGQAVKTVLTDFHSAAAAADFEGYFEHLADDAVVLGTAADERWTMSVFRPHVKSIFERGKISAEDLARYDVVWSKPLRTSYRDREICTVAAPMIGGRRLLESLNLLELADPARLGHYAKSAESCYWLIQCTRMPILLDYLPWPWAKVRMPGVSLDPEKRVSKPVVFRDTPDAERIVGNRRLVMPVHTSGGEEYSWRRHSVRKVTQCRDSSHQGTDDSGKIAVRTGLVQARHRNACMRPCFVFTSKSGCHTREAVYAALVVSGEMLCGQRCSSKVNSGYTNRSSGSGIMDQRTFPPVTKSNNFRICEPEPIWPT